MGMLSFKSVAVGFLLVSTCACNKPPPPPDDPNGPKPGTGAAQCTVGEQEIALPDDAAFRPAGGALDLDCIANPRVIAEGNALTLEGCIDVFGIGGAVIRGVSLSVFGVDQDPSTDAPRYGTTAVAVEDDAAQFACDGADANATACLATGCAKGGYYRLDGVASNIPLNLKVFATDNSTVINTYSFDVVFYEELADVDGVYRYEANVIYRSTYDSLPTAGGQHIDGQGDVTDGEGRGVVAGEVHDCADAIVAKATVTSSGYDSSTRVTYFDGDLADEKPLLTQLSTNTDGLYVMLNATTDATNNVHVITGAIVDPADPEQCLSMSTRTIKAFPDSVSIATLRGDLPVLP